MENSQQFFAWYEKVEAELEGEHARAFHGHLEQLQSHSARCNAILDEIKGALRHLSVRGGAEPSGDEAVWSRVEGWPALPLAARG